LALISKLIWINEAIFFEPKLHRLYKRLIATGMISEQATIVDVGANRGQAACFFHRLLPKARMVAVEANPDLVPLLERKTRNFAIKILPYALSESSGSLPFYQCLFDEVSTLEPPNLNSQYLKFKAKVLMVESEAMYTVVHVKTLTLDQLVAEQNLPSIDILKIDVEGHEASVLLGAQRTLSRQLARTIQLESHSDDQYQDKGDAAEAILTSHGYRLIASIKHGFGNFYEKVYVL
jgi:FkbM family methyltransferase